MAEKWGFIQSNPVKQVRFFQENRDRWYFLTKEEARRLLDNLPLETRPLFEFLLATGLRLGNVLRLRWDQIDLKQSILWIEASSTKGKRELVLPLSLWALRILKSVPRHIRSPYVFCHDDGKPYSYPYDGFKAALKRAGLPTTIRIHDLRHTYASWAIQAGVNLGVLKELLGHASLEMVMRYAHLDLETKRRAVEKVSLDLFEEDVQVANSGPMDTNMDTKRFFTRTEDDPDTTTNFLKTLMEAGLAEGEGFEPPREAFTPLADFESAPFDHSGTPPGLKKGL